MELEERLSKKKTKKTRIRKRSEKKMIRESKGRTYNWTQKQAKQISEKKKQR